MSKITEYLHESDVKHFQSPVYARLLSLTYDEGLLAAILKHAGLEKKVLIVSPSDIACSHQDTDCQK